jgi:hypothetical protein
VSSALNLRPALSSGNTFADLENLAEDTAVPLPELRRLNDLTQVQLDQP